MAFYDYAPYRYFEHSKGVSKSRLTKQIWDNVLHEKVRDKIFFRNFIGEDAGGEGSIWESRHLPPIVEKNDFTKEAGDTITIPIIKHLNVNPMTSGVVGDEVLIGREKSFDFGHQQIFIDLMREAVGVRAGMNLKRSALDLVNIALKQLSDFGAIWWDLEIFDTIYAGWSYNLLRSLRNVVFPVDTDGYYTTISPTHPNTFWGKVENTYPQQMTTDDTFNTDLIEDLKIWVEENNIVPVLYDKELTWILLIHPRQEKQLRNDPNWRNAVLYAKERASAWDHPLFKNMDYWWAGFAIFVTNRIRTAKYYGKVTIGNNKYGLRSQVQNVNGYDYVILNDTNASVPSIAGENYALPRSITADKVRGAILLGGHTVSIANGSPWVSERRKEDDYGAFLGFALQKIYGMKRNDWIDTIDASGGSVFNQSSAIIYTYSP